MNDLEKNLNTCYVLRNTHTKIYTYIYMEYTKEKVLTVLKVRKTTNGQSFFIVVIYSMTSQYLSFSNGWYFFKTYKPTAMHYR